MMANPLTTNSKQMSEHSVDFFRGKTMKNSIGLAPLTNLQSHADGSLSDEEFHWLAMRAKGGFGLTMTAACHVQACGQGFAGQLGIYSGHHIPGLSRLAKAIRAEGSLAIVQLHHAGIRSPSDVIGQAPVGPSKDEERGARELSLAEVAQLREDFIIAAQRAQKAGFDGVELHGAHNYIICQFLSGEYNRRTDAYGGSLENRMRLLLEIIAGIRQRCGEHFLIGARLSPEKFGIAIAEAITTVQRLFDEEIIDFLDLSLRDAFKEPDEEKYQGRLLMSWFTELNRGRVKLGAAGSIRSAKDVAFCLQNGLDFVLIGKAGILHHDFPKLIKNKADFSATPLPVSRDYLHKEGLSEAFINYLANSWQGFVAAE